MAKKTAKELQAELDAVITEIRNTDARLVQCKSQISNQASTIAVQEARITELEKSIKDNPNDVINLLKEWCYSCNEFGVSISVVGNDVFFHAINGRIQVSIELAEVTFFGVPLIVKMFDALPREWFSKCQVVNTFNGEDYVHPRTLTEK